jgi:hypothetical protein
MGNNTALKFPVRWIVSRPQTFRHGRPPYQEYREDSPLSFSALSDDLDCVPWSGGRVTFRAS